jgi:hypothetical protein
MPATSSTAIPILAALLATALPSSAARANLAFGKTCKASSVEGKLTPDKAVDGPKTQGSRWGSNYGTDKNKDSAWFFVDLGAAYSIDSVAIYWEHSGAKLYTLQTWNSAVDTPSYDDKGWTTIFTDTTLTYQPRPVDMCLSFIKLTPVQTRYLRVRCYKRLFEFGYSIMEFEAYGSEGSAGLRRPARDLASRGPSARPQPFRFRYGQNYSLMGRVLPD